MRARRTVDQWRAAVFRSAAISDAVRVYLLRLADHMKADRTVCVPRAQIARELNRHEQRIAERTRAAISAGFLATVSAGYKGHTAVYQGTFPDVQSDAKGTDLQYPKKSLERYAITPDCVPDGGYTTSKRPPSGPAVANVPNGEQRGGEGRGSQPVVRAAVDHLHDERRERSA
jgi:hypothetical protein